jgi:hypothetical protein
MPDRVFNRRPRVGFHAVNTGIFHAPSTPGSFTRRRRRDRFLASALIVVRCT